MSQEMITAIGTVGGGLIVFLLSINAYYFKDIVTRLRSIELGLTKLTSEHHNNIQLVDKHDVTLDKHGDRLHRLEGSLVSVQNYMGTINQYIKNIDSGEH